MRIDILDSGIAAAKYRPPGGVECFVNGAWKKAIEANASHVQEDYAGKEYDIPGSQTAGTQNIGGNQDSQLLKIECLIAEMGNGKEDDADGLFQCTPTIRPDQQCHAHAEWYHRWRSRQHAHAPGIGADVGRETDKGCSGYAAPSQATLG